MKKTTWIAVALAGIFATSVINAAPPPPPSASVPPCVAQIDTTMVANQVTAYFEQLQASLNLSAEQKKSFDDYVKVRAKVASDWAQWRNENAGKGRAMTTRQERLEHHQARVTTEANLLKSLTGARAKFVKTLTPEQVQMLDAYEPGWKGMGPKGPRHAMGRPCGMAPRGPHHGMGPGYGMGPHPGMGPHHGMGPHRGMGPGYGMGPGGACPWY